jgi:hypothetical protein
MKFLIRTAGIQEVQPFLHKKKTYSIITYMSNSESLGPVRAEAMMHVQSSELAQAMAADNPMWGELFQRGLTAGFSESILVEAAIVGNRGWSLDDESFPYTRTARLIEQTVRDERHGEDEDYKQSTVRVVLREADDLIELENRKQYPDLDNIQRAETFKEIVREMFKVEATQTSSRHRRTE